jgi:hypothetical protein
MRGSSDAYGSWKITCMRRRRGRIAARSSSVMFSPFERDRAARGLDQAQDRFSGRRFPAAAFADEAERFARTDVERHAVHGLDRADFASEEPAAHRVVLDQLVDFEHGGAHLISGSASAFQQATKWPGAASVSGGKAVRHCSLACGQRAANVQPSGMSISDGTTPRISIRRRARVDSSEARLRRGIDAINPRV